MNCNSSVRDHVLLRFPSLANFINVYIYTLIQQVTMLCSQILYETTQQDDDTDVTSLQAKTARKYRAEEDDIRESPAKRRKNRTE